MRRAWKPGSPSLPAVPHHGDQDSVPALAHRQDQGTESRMFRGPSIELLDASDARVRRRTAENATVLECIVGDDQRARAREGNGPIKVSWVVVLVRVDEDQVEGGLAPQGGERLECRAHPN